MGQKNVRIRIEHPCNQDWEAMPRMDKGLYCSQCTKVVTDFTQMSDEALITFLSKKRETEICGRFDKRQLEKLYTLQKASQRSYVSLKLALAGLLTLRLPMDAQTQPTRTSISQAVQKEDPQKKGPVKRSIKGKVTDSISRKGIHAMIRVYADRTHEKLLSTTYADSSGHYEIVLPDTGLHKFFTLTFFSDNYAERSVVEDKDNLPAFLPVALIPVVTTEISTAEVISLDVNYATGGVPLIEPIHNYVLGGASPMIETVRAPLYKRIWARVRYFFTKPFRQK